MEKSVSSRLMERWLLKAGDGKVSVVVDDCPCSVSVGVNAVGTQVIACVPWSEHEPLTGCALVHVSRVDPVTVSVFGGQTKRAASRVGAGLRRVIAHRQRVDLGAGATQIGHAPQRQDVDGRGARAGNGVGPAGIDRLQEAASIEVLQRAAIGSAQDLRGSAVVVVNDLGVGAIATRLDCLTYLEFLAVQAIAERLVLNEGKGRGSGNQPFAVGAGTAGGSHVGEQ